MNVDLKAATDMELTYRGLWQTRWLRKVRETLEAAKHQVEVKESLVRDLERDLEKINTELQSRNYHDIGHAREQFECKVVDGHKVALTDEELNPQVKKLRDEGAL